MDSSLVELVELQLKVTDVHPCLESFHPIAIKYKDSLLVFDFDISSGSYTLIKKITQPFPLPEEIQASFPLSEYDNKASCIITPKTFNSNKGYATVLHEFVHCCQFNNIELALKQELEIYKEAIEKEDYSWEITYNFPYDDSLFIYYYDNFKEALQLNKLEQAKKFRQKIREKIGEKNFEYLNWVEWKEGLARFIENKIREKLGIDQNNYGKEKPYDRVAFYYSGQLLINFLASINKSLPANMELLYKKIKNFHLK